MNVLRIEELIKQRKLDKKEVARILFPSNTYPKLALKRVFDGDGSLNATQMSRLAAFLDCSVQDLFCVDWKYRATKKAFIFTKEDDKGVRYKAVLDMQTGKTRIFADKEIYFETILHSKMIVLKDYIAFLNKIILSNPV